MVKFFIKLVCLGVIETAYIAFAIKGHTHSPLDGLGGHAVVRTRNSTFDTADKLTAVRDQVMSGTSVRMEHCTRGPRSMTQLQIGFHP